MKFKLVVILGLLILIIIAGLIYLVPMIGQTEQEKLALKFDKSVTDGCGKDSFNQDVGATLLSIGESKVEGELDANGSYVWIDYNYLITLKGKEKTQEFGIYKSINETPNYDIGTFYKFNYQTVCSSMYSAGPHGGGYLFRDENSTVLQPLVS